MPKKLPYGIGLVILLASVILASYYILSRSNQIHENWKAAIIDQLSLEQNYFNATFVNASTSILRSSGYDVQIYSGQEVDIKFYENLPSRDFEVILLRVHSAVRQGSEYVDLFTSEPFVEDKYVELGDQISKATFFSRTEEYFAIGPTFVKQSMKGNFANTTIVLMGCSSLNYTTMAEEFHRKGARVVIGWTNLMLPSESDHYVTLLLRYLFDEAGQNPIQQAVNKINTQLGVRPTLYRSLLHYFPAVEKDYIIPIRKESRPANRIVIGAVFQPSIRFRHKTY